MCCTSQPPFMKASTRKNDRKHAETRDGSWAALRERGLPLQVGASLRHTRFILDALAGCHLRACAGLVLSVVVVAVSHQLHRGVLHRGGRVSMSLASLLQCWSRL